MDRYQVVWDYVAKLQNLNENEPAETKMNVISNEFDLLLKYFITNCNY